jgi:hypothetical protein
VEHLPPANGGEDVFTLLKMYSISPSLVRQHMGIRGPVARSTGCANVQCMEGEGLCRHRTSHTPLFLYSPAANGQCKVDAIKNDLHQPLSPVYTGCLQTDADNRPLQMS